MGWIRADATMTSIIDSYKPIRLMDAKQGATDNTFIVNKDKQGRIFDGEYFKKNCLERGKTLGILENDIVLYYH